MIQASTAIRVRYSETDQMGFVYYGNYAQYLEVGRVAALKTIGISYKEMEQSGYSLPVKELKIEYHRAATYDDELIIDTRIEEMPSNRITFLYTIKRGEELLVTAATTLFFMNKDGRACRPPETFIARLAPYFNS
jgi:acyl-CoA thioester hydrolase